VCAHGRKINLNLCCVVSKCLRACTANKSATKQTQTCGIFMWWGWGGRETRDSRRFISHHGAFHWVACGIPPVPVGTIQKHVFVLSPCFKTTSKFFAPSLGLLLGLFQTHSHQLRLCVCCRSGRGGGHNQEWGVTERRIEVANSTQTHIAYTPRDIVAASHTHTHDRRTKQ